MMDLANMSDRILRSSPRVSWLVRGEIVRRTATELHADVQQEAARLLASGVTPGARVGIRAPNSYRWLVVDLALLQIRAQSVAFTADFDRDADADLIERYELSLLFVAAPSRGGGKPRHPAILDIEDTETVPAPIGPAQPNCDFDFDRPWLAFSSGSAGGVKGLALSRRGVEAAITDVAAALQCGAEDSLLLFLPMSNFQQRLLYYGLLWQGGELILSDPVTAFSALRRQSPTLIVAPPVFYDLIGARVAALPRHQKAALAVVDRVAGILPRALARLLQRAAYRAAHDALGGKVRIMITGMAPTREDTLRACERMGLPLFETYGQIETASISLNLPGANRIGSVGRLLPGVELRFGSGQEILVRRSLPVTIDYFEAADGEHERVFLPDGWIASGDIGEIDDDGFLFLRGRKKLQLINAGGEKYHPERLEEQVEACSAVRNAVVYQDEAERDVRLIASVEDDGPETVDAIKAILARHNRDHPTFRVTQETLTRERFAIDNGLLRPNLKVDRNAVIARFGTCDDLPNQQAA